MADGMDYLEDIRFLFDAEQDTDSTLKRKIYRIVNQAIVQENRQHFIMPDEVVETDMEDYLEDIRFLFEQDTMDADDYLEDIRFLFDTASLDENETAAGDAKAVKGVKVFVQKLKKMKKGMKKFCSRFVQTVRRGFCCCVSVEE